MEEIRDVGRTLALSIRMLRNRAADLAKAGQGNNAAQLRSEADALSNPHSVHVQSPSEEAPASPGSSVPEVSPAPALRKVDAIDKAEILARATGLQDGKPATKDDLYWFPRPPA